MSVSLGSQKKSSSEYGKPDAVKVARPVWMRGKAQALPMHTFRQDHTDRPILGSTQDTTKKNKKFRMEFLLPRVQDALPYRSRDQARPEK